ncbi:hypothetical protein [Catellatospora vulcania]|uniref:hypothetical protein n=1 Tax=Catellatospora vulcania TaxID=1460450 RepID=UPI0012D45FF2|nr:hypothetical protein [Catellatospora vulcania]
MISTPDTHLRLAHVAVGRVQQYQRTANGIAAFALGSVLLLWFSTFALAASPAFLSLLAALVSSLGAAGVNLARQWARYYHAESEGWLDHVLPAEERTAVHQPFLARHPAPTALSSIWSAMLVVAALLSAFAAVLFAVATA